ncbi:MAG: hypothetical protein KAI76_00565 [Alphaproteobacteria bacterium]|nr:hypothetical protein [Alphaproteobacteria bacterium]
MDNNASKFVLKTPVEKSENPLGVVPGVSRMQYVIQAMNKVKEATNVANSEVEEAIKLANTAVDGFSTADGRLPSVAGTGDILGGGAIEPKVGNDVGSSVLPSGYKSPKSAM